MQKIIALAEKVLNGQDITKEEAEYLINVSDDDTLIYNALTLNEKSAALSTRSAKYYLIPAMPSTSPSTPLRQSVRITLTL